MYIIVILPHFPRQVYKNWGGNFLGIKCTIMDEIYGLMIDWRMVP